MKLFGLSFVLFCLNIYLWFDIHQITQTHFDTPPVFEKEKSLLSTLGDQELLHRKNAMMLQNLGNQTGNTISLKDYDYQRLGEWFHLQDSLNQYSDVTPMMAAYYFGAVKDTQKLEHVVDYLAVVGARPDGEKWRWLGHAVYLARDTMQDSDKALELAYLLSNNSNSDMADWAYQMPAFLLEAKGEDHLAYEIMLGILTSRADKLHPNEVNYMVDYICNRLKIGGVLVEKPEFCVSQE